jgi:hypothetical protein
METGTPGGGAAEQAIATMLADELVAIGVSPEQASAAINSWQASGIDSIEIIAFICLVEEMFDVDLAEDSGIYETNSLFAVAQLVSRHLQQRTLGDH